MPSHRSINRDLLEGSYNCACRGKTVLGVACSEASMPCFFKDEQKEDSNSARDNNA